MQIRQQIVHLIRRQNISKAIHLIPAEHNDIAYPVVIRRHAAGAQVLLLENALQAWALASPCRIRRVATVTVLVKDVTSVSLLRSQPKFSVAATALDFAG